MSDFITLSCSSCGGKLQITNDIERFACSYCGNEQVVRRAGGIVSLAPMMAGLLQVRASTDRVAAELAVQRLSRELDEAQRKIDDAKAKVQKATQKKGRQGYLGVWPIYGCLALIAVPAFGIASFGVTASSSGDTQFRSLFACLFACSIMVAVGAFAITLARMRAGKLADKAIRTAEDDSRRAQQAYNELSLERDRQRALAKS